VAKRIRSIETFNDLIGNRTRDLPASSIVPQPNTLPRSPYKQMVVLLLHKPSELLRMWKKVEVA
jgi:hypothetical protein